jgi:HAD superfamily hydrolase (TIGR01549 family)
MNIKTEAFVQLFKPYGEDIIKKVVNHHIKYGGISRYKKIEYYYKEFLNQEISIKKINELAQKFSNLVVEKVIKSDWVIGAKGFLKKYYKKIDLFVISGTPQDELKMIIKKRDMEKYFKGVYGTPDTKPIHVKRIISKNSYNPEKVLYIGDSLSDYSDSLNVNIKFLGRISDESKSPFPKNTQLINDFLEII